MAINVLLYWAILFFIRTHPPMDGTPVWERNPLIYLLQNLSAEDPRGGWQKHDFQICTAPPPAVNNDRSLRLVTVLVALS